MGEDLREAKSQPEEELIDKLIANLDSEVFRVRIQAVTALGEIGDVRAVEPLVKLLEDDNEYVRSSATWALEQLRHEEWDFFSDTAREFMKSIESGSVSLKKNSSKDYQSGFDVVFEDWERLRDFLERVAGIMDISFDIQPEAREARTGGFPEKALDELKKSYGETAPLLPDVFVGLFVEKLRGEPELILDSLANKFEQLYVGISGSRSDRFNSLTLRPKWHYEYLLCAMKYCIEYKVQKDLKELLEGPADSNHVRFLTMRLGVDLGNHTSDESELSDYEKFAQAESAAATAMVKEAGITNSENISYKNMFKVYIAILENLLDHKLMKLWPGGLYKIMGGRDNASEYRNLFDFYVVSCKHFSSWK